jgi:NAD(P)-dependent dehydrogenase (short-subunit alcohol dehydrogenase family)
MARENSFENKRVVMGGSSGIGLAVAEEAASQGAKVVIVSSTAERVQEAIHCIGGDAGGQVVDVLDERAVESFFMKLGAFDHLVSLRAIACTCTSLLLRISRRLDEHLNCAIGLYLQRSNTEVHRFERAAPLSSQLESPAGAHKAAG